MNKDEGHVYETIEECRAAIARGARLEGKTDEGKAIVERLMAERRDRLEKMRSAVAVLVRRPRLKRKR